MEFTCFFCLSSTSPQKNKNIMEGKPGVLFATVNSAVFHDTEYMNKFVLPISSLPLECKLHDNMIASVISCCITNHPKI